MKINLPYPPTLNTMYPTNKAGRRTLSTKGRQYKAEVHARCLEQHGIFKPFMGPIRISLDLIPPDKRRRDLDNVIKPVLDGLVAAGVMGDDSQVKVIYATMALTPEESGACTVVVELSG